ncbi:HNH endonuclease [Aliifodinibius sp. S!AR15-10]|uniref:HNH endonuclease signature motif containing protein n=1 Tax=Aliifodinibius sp. S!AR15-10 TaxID=2950437 RepID=UPI0028575CBF|nr:HNH endonuclease signature motif containing protein [Aliifodinibius sp. S!AR15-10]MDR8390980.1 HNH endonuclease [Aliifodinibius sp. S!AR15-10]
MKSSDFREKNKVVEPKTGLDFSREFYQTKKWRDIREEYRKKKRAEHEKIIFKVYENNKDNSPEELIKFFTDERENPLSEKSLEKGIIKVADVCDHIKSRRYGGSDDESNLQWLTKQEHTEKTRKESKNQYDND